MRCTAKCRIIVHNGGQFVIRVDAAKFSGVLIAFENIVEDHVVRQAHFFQHNADLLAVGRGNIV